MYPEIRFIRGDGQGWQTTNAIRLTSGSNFRVNLNARDFSWNTDNPQQWILAGLPLTMGKDELLPLPMMMLSVSNSNEAGILFEKSGECLLIMKFVIRTDRGSPSLPDQIISLERKDISNSL